MLHVSLSGQRLPVQLQSHKMSQADLASAIREVLRKHIVTPDCQIADHNDNPCHCRKRFVHVPSLLHDVSCVLDKLILTLSIPFEMSSKVEEFHLVILCLVQMAHEDSIEDFIKSDITDKAMVDEYLFNRSQRLKTQLVSRVEESSANRIIAKFKKTRWIFYPAELGSLKDKRSLGKDVRIPFCARKQMSQGLGRAACVIEVSVQPQFVPEEMKDYLGLPKKCGRFGEVSLPPIF